MLNFLANSCQSTCTHYCKPGDCILDVTYDFDSGAVEKTDENIEVILKKAFKTYKNKICLKQFENSFAEFKSQYRKGVIKNGKKIQNDLRDND